MLFSQGSESTIFFFYEYALLKQFKKRVGIYILDMPGYKTVERRRATEQRVLEHLGIARAKLLRCQRVEEDCRYDYRIGLAEYAYLVFQIAEIDARLSTYRRIDGSKQRGRHVDKTDAALERSGGKSAHIGHHPSAYVDKQRMARGSLVAEAFPYSLRRVEVFMHVAGLGRYDRRSGHRRRESLQPRQHERRRIDIYKNKYFARINLCD